MLSAHATIPRLDWIVFVELPTREAQQPVIDAGLRTLALLVLGLQGGGAHWGVAYWAQGADGKGALLSGDIVQVVQDNKSVSFMWSFPNFIPLSAPRVEGVEEDVALTLPHRAPGGLGRILLEPLAELLVDRLLHEGLHLGVAELRLRLALELRLRHLDADDRRQALAAVVAGQRGRQAQLRQRLGVPAAHVLPAFEDPADRMLREGALPPNVDPADPNHLIIGGDGGVSISWDRGLSWDFRNNIPLAQFYEIDIDNKVPFTVCKQVPCTVHVKVEPPS